MPLDETHEYTGVIIADYGPDHGMILCPVTNPHTSFLPAVKELDKYKDSIDKIMHDMKTPALKSIRVAIIHKLFEELPIVGRA